MIQNEDGVAIVEYGLLVGFIAIVAFLGVSNVGKNLKSVFTVVSGSI